MTPAAPESRFDTSYPPNDGQAESHAEAHQPYPDMFSIQSPSARERLTLQLRERLDSALGCVGLRRGERHPT